MIGDFGVGKTSLVQRYVHSVFSDRYLTTVGVKISTREQTLADGRLLKLVLWDIAGSDTLTSVEEKYLRGAAAYLLVADGTRRLTLDNARALDARAQELLGPVPRLLAINKRDLSEDWETDDTELAAQDWPDRPLVRCSARTGENVDAAFARLAEMMAEHRA
jgi:small GTP-binding protein